MKEKKGSRKPNAYGNSENDKGAFQISVEKKRHSLSVILGQNSHFTPYKKNTYQVK